MGQVDVEKLLTKFDRLTTAQMIKKSGIGCIGSNVNKMVRSKEVEFEMDYENKENKRKVRYYKLSEAYKNRKW